MTPLRLAILIIALLLGGHAAAQSQPIPVPDPPQLGADGYILMDFHSGRVLVDQNSDVRRDPASITKVMTAFVVFNELRSGDLAMDEPVRISEKAWRAPGSRMFIEVGNDIPVNDLIRGMIIQSGNDASIALAEHIAGSESTFAALMNQYAAELGMTNTHYTNATGLPGDEHYSTAADTARLVQALIERFPDYYRLYSEREFTWGGITQSNRNRMLWQDPSVDGVKTGYTEAAQYCLATSAERDGMRLISVVMGAETPEQRVSQSKSLLNYGYRFFETHRLYAADEPVETPRLWKGVADTLPVGVAEDVFITLPADTYDQLDARIRLNEPLEAPVAAGDRVGRLSVSRNDEVVRERDIIALETVPEAGFVGRTIDTVRLWLN
ncbi:D-alanyl-D-alanine carboxypeptidase family protein [Spiribacter sp. 1M153]|jgi:D-alanyl-D-alanine carboxypeptidase (penicillin-binding protein 5/6)|uniref:D-alanyl-D-alanine carboxypeptidase family protein n=1 Tax=Spiribacter TaxID=1335745 RepID=UPI00132FAB59|nr:D-alanyl-D-alanine carboxypeptidase family protein [Spiribacter sp. SSL99]KAF0285249.1 serine-type D-Ala-D-Ala carboxypeptidase [Spiribacter sp. SSL99]